MGKVFSSIFGGSKSSGSTPTAWQSLPEPVQDVFLNDFLGVADEDGNYTSGSILDVFNNPQLFEPTEYDVNIHTGLQGLRDTPLSSHFGQDTLVGGGVALQDAYNQLDNFASQQARSDSFLDQASGLLNNGANQINAATGNINRGTSDITDAEYTNRFNRFNNPFTTNVIDAFANDVQRNAAGLFSDIDTQATLDGAFGSTRQAVERAELGRNIADVIAKESANQRSNAFTYASGAAQQDLQNLRNRSLQGAGLNIGQGSATGGLASTAISGANSAQNAARNELGASGQLASISNQAKGLRQIERDENIANNQFDLFVGDYLRQLEEQKRKIPFERLNLLQGGLMSFPTGGGQQQKTSDNKGIGLDNALGIGGFLSGVFSDERLKENIQYILTTADNIDLYSYNYIGNKTQYVGVMAQKIKDDFPEAVTMDESGYYKVDYDKLPVQLIEVKHG